MYFNLKHLKHNRLHRINAVTWTCYRLCLRGSAQSVMNITAHHCPLSVRHGTFFLTLYIFFAHSWSIRLNMLHTLIQYNGQTVNFHHRHVKNYTEIIFIQNRFELVTSTLHTASHQQHRIKKKNCAGGICVVLTFGESLFKTFPVDMSEDVVWLPVEMSEGQLTEELFAGKQTSASYNFF